MCPIMFDSPIGRMIIKALQEGKTFDMPQTNIILAGPRG